MRTLREALIVACTRIEGRHDPAHPRHLTFLCLDLIGMLDVAAQEEKCGKARQEQRIRQMLPPMRGLLDELWKDTK